MHCWVMSENVPVQEATNGRAGNLRLGGRLH
jgi:hypothetical protein